MSVLGGEVVVGVFVDGVVKLLSFSSDIRMMLGMILMKNDILYGFKVVCVKFDMVGNYVGWRGIELWVKLSLRCG